MLILNNFIGKGNKLSFSDFFPDTKVKKLERGKLYICPFEKKSAIAIKSGSSYDLWEVPYFIAETIYSRN